MTFENRFLYILYPLALTHTHICVCVHTYVLLARGRDWKYFFVLSPVHSLYAYISRYLVYNIRPWITIISFNNCNDEIPTVPNIFFVYLINDRTLLLETGVPRHTNIRIITKGKHICLYFVLKLCGRKTNKLLYMSSNDGSPEYLLWKNVIIFFFQSPVQTIQIPNAGICYY